jgi:hypothetical protein
MTKPRKKPTDGPLATALKAMRPDSYSHLAKRLDPPVSRQHVRATVIALDGGDPHAFAPRIEKAIRLAVARKRFP